MIAFCHTNIVVFKINKANRACNFVLIFFIVMVAHNLNCVYPFEIDIFKYLFNKKKMSSSVTNEELRLINIYREIYNMNNEQITAMNSLQANILQKINNIITRSQQRQTNLYIYADSSSSTSGGGNSNDLDSSLNQTSAATESSVTTTTSPFGNLTNPVNSECPITFERFRDETMVTKINSCGHVFICHALNIWLETRNTCPVCRQTVRQTSRGRTLANSLTNLTETLISRFLTSDSSYNSTSTSTSTTMDSSSIILEGITLL